ncbi:glycosyl hydrolase family 18 protein [Leptospira kmetyi]|uniref:glycosyl hydrolase family 18 protein n=1 Tax=Leptospira kmetyi TaxID=408139 RepID=UPI0010838621|nr:glycosyl hydrolase family 18 protein [Leptospira kmetyi]TGK16285.1 glycosyl hydrolase [Leptospira kmetyi]TGK32315.1 glycosyl hydrolase [Leptospira kmetyi]
MNILRIITILSLFVGHTLWATEQTLHWNYALFVSLEKGSNSDWVDVCSKSHTISYTGNVILSNGNFKSSALPKGFLDLCKNYKTRLIPLITAARKASSGFLKSDRTIENATLELSNYLIRNPEIAGLHLDVEFLPSSEISNFRKFLRALKNKLPKEKVLTVAIFPQIDFPNRNSVVHADILTEEAIDEFVLMSYDFHSPQTAPGPVTSFSLTKKNLEFLSERIPGSKLWLGLPLYGYFWDRNGKTRILTQKDLRKFRENSQIVSDSDGFSVLKNEDGIGFISDPSTLEKFNKHLSTFGLKGTAYWRIGF